MHNLKNIPLKYRIIIFLTFFIVLISIAIMIIKMNQFSIVGTWYLENDINETMIFTKDKTYLSSENMCGNGTYIYTKDDLILTPSNSFYYLVLGNISFNVDKKNEKITATHGDHEYIFYRNKKDAQQAIKNTNSITKDDTSTFDEDLFLQNLYGEWNAQDEDWIYINSDEIYIADQIKKEQKIYTYSISDISNVENGSKTLYTFKLNLTDEEKKNTKTEVEMIVDSKDSQISFESKTYIKKDPDDMEDYYD